MVDAFDEDVEMHYQMARYAVGAGDLKSAYTSLMRAFEQSDDDPALKLRALDDKILEPFWLDIREN